MLWNRKESSFLIKKMLFKKTKIVKFMIVLSLRDELHVDFRAKCVVITQITWGLHPILYMRCFQKIESFVKMFQMFLTAKKVDYIFEEKFNLHIIVG